MRRSRPSRARAALRRSAAFALVLGAAFAPAARASDRARDVESDVAAALERVAAPSDIARESRVLAALGKPALRPLFERLCGDGAGDALRSATVFAALAQLPRDDVLGVLAELARSQPSDARRRTGLDLLGRVGARAELKLALDLSAAEGSAQPLAPELGAALEGALLGMCEREPGAVRTLAGFFARALPADQEAIVRVVARAGGDEAAGLLAAQLGSAGPAADALLVDEIGACGAKSGGSDDQLVLDRVRGLLGHPDKRLATLACVALDKLRDHQGVPDLIVLLGDDDPNLRGRAFAALTSLTGMHLAADAEPWIAWLDAGLAWWDERADAARVALVSGSASEAAAAVHEIAGQRLYAQRVAELLALALRRPELDIVKSACRALGSIPERAAYDALVRVLAHPDPSVVLCASAELARLERARPNSLRRSGLPVRSRIQ